MDKVGLTLQEASQPINPDAGKFKPLAASVAHFGRAGAFLGDQAPRRIFVGLGVTPDIFLAIIAETVEMHLAVVGRPETGTYST